MTQKNNAVVLLSGGLDSSTTLAIAQNKGYNVHALSFAYGQRHTNELEAAKKIAKRHKVADHRIATIDLRLFGGSALTDSIDVPKMRTAEDMGEGVPITYVPARNIIFLSFALAWAETLNATDIFIGVNVLDYSGYPDCRPAFIKAYELMANIGTAYAIDSSQGITIHAPLQHMTKAQIIRKGLELDVEYSLTVSCYDPQDGKACGECDACQLRLKGFRENGIEDPISYAKK
jgi:7-cyano-7-deazaguanine synthase